MTAQPALFPEHDWTAPQRALIPGWTLHRASITVDIGPDEGPSLGYDEFDGWLHDLMQRDAQRVTARLRGIAHTTLYVTVRGDVWALNLRDAQARWEAAIRQRIREWEASA